MVDQSNSKKINNLLVLSDRFPPLHTAGAENIAHLISKEYQKKAYDITVITINENLDNGECVYLEYDDLKIYQIGSKYNLQFQAYIGLYNPWVLKSIKSILEKNHYDRAHMHNIHMHISYSVIHLLKQNNIKSIITLHDAMSIEYGKFTQGINSMDKKKEPIVNKKINAFKSFLKHKRGYNPFRNLIIRYFFKDLYKIITVSNEQALLLNQNKIYNTRTIHNGIEKKHSPLDKEKDLFRKKYNIKNDEKLLLWAGRLSKDKGSKQVFKVLKTLLKHNYKIRLLVAGQEITDKEMSEYIITTGWLSSKEMDIAYSISYITLVPSICYDMFPTVVLESMRAGKPIVAGCFGGAKEAIENDCGYIINPFNTEDFFLKITTLLDDENLYASFSKNCLERFNKNFTINRCVEDYLEEIQ